MELLIYKYYISDDENEQICYAFIDISHAN